MYLGVDVAHGHKFPEAMQQLNMFRGKDIKAVFCDIRHTPNQTPFAMGLRADLQAEIEQMWPDIKNKAKDIYIRLNIDSARTLKARDKMYEILGEYKTKHVKYKAPDDREQDVNRG